MNEKGLAAGLAEGRAEGLAEGRTCEKNVGKENSQNKKI